MSSPEHSPQSDPVAAARRHRARLAATSALVLALLGLWLAISLVANDPISVVLAFGCVFLVAYSVWFLMIRRGVARLLILPLGLFGLVGLITFFYEQWLQLTAVIVMVVLFGFAARYAVRHQDGTVHTAHTAHRHARPAQPAQNGVLLINPRSGGGKAERFNLHDEARKRGVEPVLLGPDTDLRELAESALSNGADVIGVAGGDGSQALVASVAMKHGVAHVCIPAGTRNHFAQDLGLDRSDVVGALDAFTDGVERLIDLARVNGHVFVNNASLGLYARVVQSDAYREAKIRTWRRLLPEMLGPQGISVDLQFEGPDEKRWADAALVVVSNNPYRVKRLAGVGTRPRLDTGSLGIVAARLHSSRAVAKMVTLGTIGQSHRGLRHWSCLEFEVHSDGCIAVGLDGEALVLTPPLRFASLPGALRVRLPRHARGVSPAAAGVGLTRANVATLFRIAAGRRSEALPPV
jgi:diacylglycerol kinase family enzyme